jgi:hypothetical protein
MSDLPFHTDETHQVDAEWLTYGIRHPVALRLRGTGTHDRQRPALVGRGMEARA